MSMQSIEELDQWHASDDPWQYESTPDDLRRKAILLSEIPQRTYGHTLDIGCGQGFVTRDLPGNTVTGIDISGQAITHAQRYSSSTLQFQQASIFDLASCAERYDLIVMTGVLYPQYIGNSLTLIYRIVDRLLTNNGILVSVHIDAWYKARFPLLMLKQHFYDYREYTHRLEVYSK